MKLIIKNGRVVATATDGYTGPETHIAAPEGFDIERMGDYVVTGDAATLPAIDVRALVVAATQARLDDFALTRNYDGILSAASYATDPSPRFASDGQCAVNARSATWAALYQVLSEVEAGTRPMPASFSDVEPALPVLEWPV